jgi:hypothetical protein
MGKLHKGRQSLSVYFKYIFPPMAQQPLVGQGLLIIEASRSHSDTPHWIGVP